MFIYYGALKDQRHYIGYTDNLERRLKDHNRGKSTSIKHRGPFKLVYSEERSTKIEAIHRERQIKSYKGGSAFEKLLGINQSPSSSLV